LNFIQTGTLERCSLLIVSDLQTIDKRQVQLLKQLLGRDTISKEIKYDPSIGVVAPYCFE
jgi:hypothetical protein